jgi:hypothetical protein
MGEELSKCKLYVAPNLGDIGYAVEACQLFVCGQW